MTLHSALPALLGTFRTSNICLSDAGNGCGAVLEEGTTSPCSLRDVMRLTHSRGIAAVLDLDLEQAHGSEQAQGHVVLASFTQVIA